MEYLKSRFKTAFPSRDAKFSEVDIVEKLVQRVTSSTSLNDRRDACRALKSLSRKYRIIVGAQGMEALLGVIRTEREDTYIQTYALEALSNVIYCIDELDNDEAELTVDAENVGLEFTEIYLKNTENITLLLEILKASDTSSMLGCLKLLIGLAIHKLKEVQECIIAYPNGVSCIMDTLSDPQRRVRNDGLFLMVHLTKENLNFQKIVAFQNAFEIIFRIVEEEFVLSDGETVEDALTVMHNLLNSNPSNQALFREGIYSDKLFECTCWILSKNDESWPEQRQINACAILKVIRTFVCPCNPAAAVSSYQNMLHCCGLLRMLCDLLLLPTGIPVDVLCECICAIAETVRGHIENQSYFASVGMASSSRSLVVAVLMTMLNEKQPFALRCAALYCFQCFLYRNNFQQSKIIESLLPSTPSFIQNSPGHMICASFSTSDLSWVTCWFASVALMHALVNNSVQKEQLLRVQLSTREDNLPFSLLKHITATLHKGGKLQTNFGLLMLLCMWLADCPYAVAKFLEESSFLQFIISEVSLKVEDEQECLVQGLCAFLLGVCIRFNDDDISSIKWHELRQMIDTSIGLEIFLKKIEFLGQHSSFLLASHHGHLEHVQPSFLGFDYEFCCLFQKLESVVFESVECKPVTGNLFNPCDGMSPEHLELLEAYKSGVHDQDHLLASMRNQIEALENEYSNVTASISEMSTILQQLKEQNCQLSARRDAPNNSGESSEAITEEYVQLKNEHEDFRQKFLLLEQQLEEKTRALADMHKKNKTGIEKLGKEPPSSECDYLETIQAQELEIDRQREVVSNLEIHVESLKEENCRYQILVQKNLEAQEVNANLKTEMLTLQSEQEDLQLLLEDQKDQILIYRSRLKELGEEDVSNEDELPKSHHVQGTEDLLENGESK